MRDIAGSARLCGTVSLIALSIVLLTDAGALAQTAATVTSDQDAVTLDPIDVEGQGDGISRGGVAEVNVTAEDLERLNPTDIKDVFRDQPGVQVGSSLPMSQKVYVQGVEETNLNVTIDGSRQNNKVFHHNATNLIDPLLLKAARVDAGVAPADAGPGALAGAIAYETKDVADLLPGDGFGGFLKTIVNSNGPVFTNNLAGYGRHNGFEFLGSFTFAKGDEFENGDGREVPGTETDLLSGLGKLAYETRSGHRFEVSHERVRDDASRPFRANIGFISGRPPWEPRVRDYMLDRQNTVFTYSMVAPQGWWDPTAVLAYSKTEVDTNASFCPGGCPSGVPFSYATIGETESLNGKIENKFNIGSGEIVAGFDFYKDKADLIANDSGLGIDEDARERADNIGFYAQARLSPTDRWRLSFGARGDQQWFEGTNGFESDDFGLSANVSSEYDLIEDVLTAKAGYSHAFAGVQIAENFIMNPAWDYDDGPQSTTADNFFAGLEARYQGFTVDGKVFRTEIDDARIAAYRVILPTGELGAIQSRDLVSKGFELGARYSWTDGFVRVAYAHIDVEVNGAPADSDIGNYLASPVGDIITISAAHTFTGWGITIGGDAEIAPEYDNVVSGAPAYASYAVFNAFAEYKPQTKLDLTFRAEVNNIFDELYSDRATYGQEFGTVTPLFEPGRSLVLSATVKF